MLDKENSNVSKNMDTPAEGNTQNVTSNGAKIQDTTSDNAGNSADADTLVVATLVANDYNGDDDYEMENENITDYSSGTETARSSSNINHLLSVVRLSDSPAAPSTQNQMHIASTKVTLSTTSIETTTTQPTATNPTKNIYSSETASPLVIDTDCDQMPYTVHTYNNRNNNEISTQRARRPTISVKCFSPVSEVDNNESPISPAPTPNFDDADDDDNNDRTTVQQNQANYDQMHDCGSQIPNSSNNRTISFQMPAEVRANSVSGGDALTPNPVEIIDLESVASDICRVESPANSSVTAASPSRMNARNMPAAFGRRAVAMRHIRRAPKEPEEYLDALFPHIREAHQRIRQALLHSPLTDVKDNVLLKRKMLEVIQLYARGCKKEFERVGNSVILCRRLKRNIIRLLDLFNEICNSSRQNAFFLYHVSQLIAVYSSLEIRLSFNMTRLQKCALIHRLAHVINKHLVVNNESLAKENILRMFLHMPDMYSARFILEPLFNTFLPEILTSSKLRDQKELPDKTFVQYIIILQQWKEMLRDPFEQVELINKAQYFMCPTKTLHSNSIYANHLPIIHTRKNAVKDILNNLKFFQDLKNAAISDDSMQDVDDDIIVVIDEDADTPAWDFGATYTAEAKYLRYNKTQSRKIPTGPVECVDLTEDDGCHQESRDEKVDDLTWLTTLKERACGTVTVDESENVICLDSDSDGELFAGSIIDPSESYQDCDGFDTDYTSPDGSTSDDKAASEDETLPTSRITPDGLRTYLAPRSKTTQPSSTNERRMMFTRRPSYLGSPYVRTRDVDGGDGDSATVGTKISALTSNESNDSETPWPLILNTFSVRDKTSQHFSKSARFDSGIDAERYESDGMQEMPEQNSEDGDEEDEVDLDDEEYHSLPSASSSNTTMGKVIFSQSLPENNRKSSRKEDDVQRGLNFAADKLANKDYNEKGSLKIENKRITEDITMPLRNNAEDKAGKPVKKQVKFNDHPIGPTRRLSMNDVHKLPIKPAIQLNKQQLYSHQQCSNQHCSNQHCTTQHCSNQHCTNQHCTNQHCSNQHYNNQHCSNQHDYNQHCSNQHVYNQHCSNQHPYYNQHLNMLQPRLTSPASSTSSATDSLKQMAQQGRRFIDIDLNFHSNFENISKCSSATIIDSKCDDIIDVISGDSETTIRKDDNLKISTQTVQSKNSSKHGLIDFYKLISKHRENKLKKHSHSKKTTTMCRPKDISSTNFNRNESVKSTHLNDYKVDVNDDNVDGNISVLQYDLGILENKKKSDSEEQNSNVSTTTGPNIDYRTADEHEIVRDESSNNSKQMLATVESTSLGMYAVENNVGSSDICTSSTTELILQDTDLKCDDLATKLQDDDDMKGEKRLRCKSVKAAQSALLSVESLSKNVKRNKKVDDSENTLENTRESVKMLDNEKVIYSGSKNVQKNKISPKKLLQGKTGRKNMHDNGKKVEETKQKNINKKHGETKTITERTELLKIQQKKQEAEKATTSTNVDNDTSKASVVDPSSFANTLDEQNKLLTHETTEHATKKENENVPEMAANSEVSLHLETTVSKKFKAQSSVMLQETSSAIETELLSVKEAEEVTQMKSDTPSSSSISVDVDETIPENLTPKILGMVIEKPTTVSTSETSFTDKQVDKELNETTKPIDDIQLNTTVKSRQVDLTDTTTAAVKTVQKSARENKVQTRLKLKTKTKTANGAAKNETILEVLEQPSPTSEAVEEEKVPDNLGATVELKLLASSSQTNVNEKQTCSETELNELPKTEDGSQISKILKEETANINQTRSESNTNSSSTITKSESKNARENKRLTRSKLKSKSETDSSKQEPSLGAGELVTVETVEEKEVSNEPDTIVEKTNADKVLEEGEKTEDASQISKIINKAKKNIKQEQPSEITKSSASPAKPEEKRTRGKKMLPRLKLKSTYDTNLHKSQLPSIVADNVRVAKVGIDKGLEVSNITTESIEETQSDDMPNSSANSENIPAKETAKLKSLKSNETIKEKEFVEQLDINVEKPPPASCSESNLDNSQISSDKALNEIATTEDDNQISETFKKADNASDSSPVKSKLEPGKGETKKVAKLTPETATSDSETQLEESESQSFSRTVLVSHVTKTIEWEEVLQILNPIVDESTSVLSEETEVISNSEEFDKPVSKITNKNSQRKRADVTSSDSSIMAKLEEISTTENRGAITMKTKSIPKSRSSQSELLFQELKNQSLSKTVKVSDKVEKGIVETVEEETSPKKLDTITEQSSETNLISDQETAGTGLIEIAKTKISKLLKSPLKNIKKTPSDANTSSSAAKLEEKHVKESKVVSRLKSKSKPDKAASNNQPIHAAVDTVEEQQISKIIVEQPSTVSTAETNLTNKTKTYHKGSRKMDTTELLMQVSKILSKPNKISKRRRTVHGAVETVKEEQISKIIVDKPSTAACAETNLINKPEAAHKSSLEIATTDQDIQFSKILSKPNKISKRRRTVDISKSNASKIEPKSARENKQMTSLTSKSKLETSSSNSQKQLNELENQKLSKNAKEELEIETNEQQNTSEELVKLIELPSSEINLISDIQTTVAELQGIETIEKSKEKPKLLNTSSKSRKQKRADDIASSSSSTVNNEQKPTRDNKETTKLKTKTGTETNVSKSQKPFEKEAKQSNEGEQLFQLGNVVTFHDIAQKAGAFPNSNILLKTTELEPRKEMANFANTSLHSNSEAVIAKKVTALEEGLEKPSDMLEEGMDITPNQKSADDNDRIYKRKKEKRKRRKELKEIMCRKYSINDDIYTVYENAAQSSTSISTRARNLPVDSLLNLIKAVEAINLTENYAEQITEQGLEPDTDCNTVSHVEETQESIENVDTDTQNFSECNDNHNAFANDAPVLAEANDSTQNANNATHVMTEDDVQPQTPVETSIIENADTTEKCEPERMYFSEDNIPKTNLERLAEAVMLTEAVTQQQLSTALGGATATAIDETPDITVEGKRVRFSVNNDNTDLETNISQLQAVNSFRTETTKKKDATGKCLKRNTRRESGNTKEQILGLRSPKKVEKNNMKMQTKSNSTSNLVNVSAKTTTTYSKTSPTHNKISKSLHSSLDDFISLLEKAKPTKLVEVTTQRKSPRTLNLDSPITAENMNQEMDLLINNDSVSNNTISTEKDSNSDLLDSCANKSPTLATSDSDIETTKGYSLPGTEQWEVINNTSMRATPPENTSVVENVDVKKSVANTLSKRCIKIRLARAKIPKKKSERKLSDSSTDEAVKNFEYEFGDVTYRPITRKLSAALNHTLQMETDSSIIDPIEPPLYRRGRKSKAKLEKLGEDNVPTKRKRLDNVEAVTSNAEKSIRTVVKNKSKVSFLETLGKAENAIECRIPSKVKHAKDSFLEAPGEGKRSNIPNEGNNENKASFLDKREKKGKHEECAIVACKTLTELKNKSKATFLEGPDRISVEVRNKKKASFLEHVEGEEDMNVESDISKIKDDEVLNKNVAFLEAAAEETTNEKECNLERMLPNETTENTNVVSFLETTQETFSSSKVVKEQKMENSAEKPDIFQKVVLLETQTKKATLSEKAIANRSKSEKAKKLANILDAVFLKAVRRNSTTMNILSSATDIEKETGNKKSVKPIKIDNENLNALHQSLSVENEADIANKNILTTDSHSESNKTAEKSDNETMTETEAQLTSTELSKNNAKEKCIKVQTQKELINHKINSNEVELYQSQKELTNNTINSDKEQLLQAINDNEVNVVHKVQRNSKEQLKDLRIKEKHKRKYCNDELFEPISDDEFELEKTLSDTEEPGRNSPQLSKVSKNYTDENSNMEKTLEASSEDKRVESTIDEINTVQTQNDLNKSIATFSEFEPAEQGSDETNAHNFVVNSKGDHNEKEEEVCEKQYQKNQQNPLIMSSSENKNVDSSQINTPENSSSPLNNSETPDHADFTNLSHKLTNYNTKSVNEHDAKSAHNSHCVSLPSSEITSNKDDCDYPDKFQKNMQDEKALGEYKHNTADANYADSKFCYSDVSSHSSTSCCSCTTTSEATSETDLCKNEPTSFKVAQSEAQVSELLSNTSTSIQDLSLLYLDHEIMSNDALLSELIMDIVSTPTLEHNYAIKPLETVMKRMDDIMQGDERVKIGLSDLCNQTKKVLSENDNNENVQRTLQELDVTNMKEEVYARQDNANTESILDIEEPLKTISLKVSIPLINIKKLEKISTKDTTLFEEPSTSKASIKIREEATLQFDDTQSKTLFQEKTEELQFSQVDSRKRSVSPNRSTEQQLLEKEALLERKRRQFFGEIEEDISDMKADIYDRNDETSDYCENVILENNNVEELDGTLFLHKEFNTQFENDNDLKNMGAKRKEKQTAVKETTTQLPEDKANKEDHINDMKETQYQDEAQTINNEDIVKDIQIDSQYKEQILAREDEFVKNIALSQRDQQDQTNEEAMYEFQTSTELEQQSVEENLETTKKQDEDESLNVQTREQGTTQQCLEQAAEHVQVQNYADFEPLNKDTPTEMLTKNDSITENVTAPANIELPIKNNASQCHGFKDITITELQKRTIQESEENTNYDDHAGEVTLTNYEDEFFVTSCLNDAPDALVVDDGFKQSKHLKATKEYATTNAYKTKNDALISAQDEKDDSNDFLDIQDATKTSKISAIETTLKTSAGSLEKDLLKTNEIIDFVTTSTTSTPTSSSNPLTSAQKALLPSLTDVTTTTRAAPITTQPTNSGTAKRGFDMPDLDSDFDVVPDTTNRASIADLKQMNELSYVGVKTPKRAKFPPASISKFKKRLYSDIATTSKPTTSTFNSMKKIVRTAGVLPAVSKEPQKDLTSRPTKQQQPSLSNIKCQENVEENCLDAVVSSTTTTNLEPVSPTSKELTTTDISTALTNELTTIFSLPEFEQLETPSSTNSIEQAAKKVRIQSFNTHDENVTIITPPSTSSSISDNTPSTSRFNMPTSTNTIVEEKLTTTSPFQYAATSISNMQLKPTRVSTRARAPARVQIVTPQRKNQDHLKKSHEQRLTTGITFSNHQARAFCSPAEFNSRQLASTLLHTKTKQNITQHTNLIHFERYIQKLMAFIDVPTIIRSARNLLVDKYALSEAHAAILAQASQYDCDGNEISQPLLLKDHKDGTISILYDNDDCIKLTTNLSKMVKKLSLALSILQEQQSPTLSMRARIKTLLKQLTETAETSMIKTIAPPIISSPSTIPTAVVNPTNLTENTARDIMELDTLNNVELFNNGGSGGGSVSRQQTTAQQQQQQQTYPNNTQATTNMFTNWNDAAEENNQLMTNITNGDLPLENEDQLMDIDPLPLLADDGGAGNYEHSLTFDFEDSLTMLSTNESYENPFEDLLGRSSNVAADDESTTFNWIDAEQNNSIMLAGWQSEDGNNEESNGTTSHLQEHNNGGFNNMINLMAGSTGIDAEDFSSITIDNLDDEEVLNAATNDEQVRFLQPATHTITNAKTTKMFKIPNSDIQQTLQKITPPTTNMRIYRNIAPYTAVGPTVSTTAKQIPATLYRHTTQQRLPNNIVAGTTNYLQQQQTPQSTSHITIDNVKNIQLFAQQYTPQNSTNVGGLQQGNSIRLVLAPSLKNNHNNTNNTKQLFLGATTSAAAIANDETTIQDTIIEYPLEFQTIESQTNLNDNLNITDENLLQSLQSTMSGNTITTTSTVAAPTNAALLRMVRTSRGLMNNSPQTTIKLPNGMQVSARRISLTEASSLPSTSTAVVSQPLQQQELIQLQPQQIQFIQPNTNLTNRLINSNQTGGVKFQIIQQPQTQVTTHGQLRLLDNGQRVMYSLSPISLMQYQKQSQQQQQAKQ